MLSDCDPAAGCTLILLPLFLTVLLNLAHASAVYLDDTQLTNRAASGDRTAAALERLLMKNDRAKLSVQLFSYLSAALSAAGAIILLKDAPEAAKTAALFLAPLLFYALAVLSPRRIAAYHAQKTAYALSGLLRLCCTILSPVTICIRGLSSLAVRLTGSDPSAEPSQITEEEIRMLVDEGEENGVIDEGEKKMINNIFEFDDRDVSEVMTHRTEVNAVPVTATLSEAVDVAMRSGNTRLPVYEDDIDSVCGILYAKDLLQFLEKPEGFSMRQVMREPLYVPESGSCADVFQFMQHEKTQIAVVVDEYGGTYGIVTMEDLLETIVGSIQDEYDDEQPEVTDLGEGKWLLDASMGLSEAEDLLDIRFPDDSESDTLGGFLIEQIGYVPKGGPDSPAIVVGGVRLSAKESDDRRILTVRAERLPDPFPEHSES